MDRSDAQRWLDAYVEAWTTYDRAAIGDLFSEDAEYRYRPPEEPVRGRHAIVESWLSEERRDPPGTYSGRYRPVAVDGDLVVATGTSTYYSGAGGEIEKIYDNCYVMRFDADGRCRSFTEWFMLRP